MKGKSIKLSLQMRFLVSFLVLIVRPVESEKTYSQYQILSAKNFTAASASACIAGCLGSTSCVAMSFCTLPSGTTTCTLSTCANINLVPSTSCQSIVFSDISDVDGSSLTQPIHEWISTDECGYTGSSCAFNTGTNALPSLINGASSTVQSIFADGYFFGKSSVKTAPLFASTSIQVNITAPITIFFSMMFPSSLQPITLFELTYTDTTSQSISVSYLQNDLMSLSSSFSGCGTSCTTQSSALSLQVNRWYAVAFTFEPSVSARARVYIDSVLKIDKNYTGITFPTTNPNASLSFGTSATGSANLQASVYCLKIFDYAMSSTNLAQVARTCSAGKITFRSYDTATNSSSCPQSNWYLDGKSYYVGSSATTRDGAIAQCQSTGKSLISIDSLGEYMYLAQVLLPTLNSINYNPSKQYWTSLNGTSFPLTWLTTGATVASLTSFPAGTVTFNGNTKSCFVASTISSTMTISITGQDCSTANTYLPLCTCQ